MYLTERKLFFSVNHVFSGLTGRRDEDDFSWFASYVPAFEVRNGQMWPEANASAERLAKRLGKIGIAGSDAHTIAGVGRTYTEVPGVRTVDEFLAGLRAGRGIVHGVHGSYAKLTADVYRIVKAFLRREAMGAADFAVDRAGAGDYGGSLAERNSLLPQMVGSAGKRRKASAHVVEAGFEPGSRIWRADVRRRVQSLEITKY